MLIHEFIAINGNEIPKDIPFDIIKNRECVRISDDLILDNQTDFLSSFRTHWWEIGNVHEGLDYHGITIIESRDIDCFLHILRKYEIRKDVKELIKLCENAKEKGEYIIHFGI